jgi:hypothetical protein
VSLRLLFFCSVAFAKGLSFLANSYSAPNYVHFWSQMTHFLDDDDNGSGPYSLMDKKYRKVFSQKGQKNSCDGQK